MARRLAAGQSEPVFRYLFAAFPDNTSPSTLGARHAVEVLFVMQLRGPFDTDPMRKRVPRSLRIVVGALASGLRGNIPIEITT